MAVSNPKQSPTNWGRGRSTTTLTVLVAAAATMAAIVYPSLWKADERLHEHIEHELGVLLSPGASIILPGMPEFRDKTARWIDSLSPEFGAVVAVATEQDVQQTV
jgi:hypothetical protein